MSKRGFYDSVKGVDTSKKESPWEEALRLTQMAEKIAKVKGSTKKTFHLEGAKGAALDRFAEIHALEREFGEHDEEFRKRVLGQFKIDTGALETIPEEVKAEEDWFLDELGKL